jgi:hypothetical protein
LTWPPYVWKSFQTFISRRWGSFKLKIFPGK